MAVLKLSNIRSWIASFFLIMFCLGALWNIRWSISINPVCKLFLQSDNQNSKKTPRQSDNQNSKETPRQSDNQNSKETPSLDLKILQNEVIVKLPRMNYTQPRVLSPPRTDVLLMTPWFAPIVWENTFNTDILNEIFRQQNVTIGLTAFAVKKYVIFVETFIKTAEEHFMVGYNVNYYIFTDRPENLPNVTLKEGRKLIPVQIEKYDRWQEISMRRMEMINMLSDTRFIKEVDYLVCVDIDMKFADHVGVEILSDRFGTLHPGFYGSKREGFTYERRTKSKASIPSDEGDFYYAGGFFGGRVPQIYHLTKACHEAIMEDKKNGIEAVWHDESYLNKYFVNHKPTKILSPEYLWDNGMGSPPILKKKRFLAVPKNHAAIRSNNKK